MAADFDDDGLSRIAAMACIRPPVAEVLPTGCFAESPPVRTNFACCTVAIFFALPANLAWLALARAADDEDVLAGHSYHGEAFNEGPRQAAYLMPGMGNIDFPVTTQNELAQRFFNQGVSQLHGFWYYEAERSFRQAAVLDPDCAMFYWGMAMANTENRERAADFIEEASERLTSASEREKLYVAAMQQFCRNEDDEGKEISKKDRAQKLTHDLEEIVEEFPDDIEAKAFLAVTLWQNTRADLPIVSHVAINSLLGEVFAANPEHPAHHYRIHLWDRHKPKRAVASAALCGQSSPGIAHMWHMPGHIFDKLHRYHDAVWQQEASARVDHAHMMRDRVMPDQIHNFAHNNEWCIRNLLKVGRVDDAISLAKNMLELPRHPDYNTLKTGSTKYGRERLVLALTQYRLWPELIELAETDYLEPTNEPEMQAARSGWLGFALAMTGETARADELREELQSQLELYSNELSELSAAQPSKAHEPNSAESKSSEPDSLESEVAAVSDSQDRVTATQPSPTDSKKAKANRERRKKEAEKRTKELKKLVEVFEENVHSIKAGLAAVEENWEDALAAFDKSALSDKLLKAEWLLANQQTAEAMKLLDKEVKDKPGQLLPVAVKAFVQSIAGEADETEETFAEVRKLASAADLGTPLLARLEPVAAQFGLTGNWADDYVVAEDAGQRPDLDALGPFRWRPYIAPEFVVQGLDAKKVRSRDSSDRPKLVIFYLGFGCLHCVEQLHEFSPRAEDFRKSGIDVLAISTEKIDTLVDALASYSNPLDIPLHADPELTAFKAYRCFDDFEQQPLHGTFLIDPEGRVLWQDISYEPFMDVDFLLDESRRLLELAGFEPQLPSPKSSKLIGASD